MLFTEKKAEESFFFMLFREVMFGCVDADFASSSLPRFGSAFFWLSTSFECVKGFPGFQMGSGSWISPVCFLEVALLELLSEDASLMLFSCPKLNRQFWGCKLEKELFLGSRDFFLSARLSPSNPADFPRILLFMLITRSDLVKASFLSRRFAPERGFLDWSLSECV